MFISRHQTARKNSIIKACYKYFKNAANLKYFGTAIKDQNCVYKETKRKLKPGNACRHTVQNLLSSQLI
jgi:hypothetical protein